MQLPPESPLLLADLFSLCPQVQKVDLRWALPWGNQNSAGRVVLEVVGCEGWG